VFILHACTNVSQVNYVQCLNWVKPLQFYKKMNPDEAAEVQLIEERLRQVYAVHVHVHCVYEQQYMCAHYCTA
jgi:hypothetical protein